MPQFHRESRVVVWEGHVATPGVERLQNGDILITARYPDPHAEQPRTISGMKRSRDNGKTWEGPIHQFIPSRPDHPTSFLAYHGMAELNDGTILLPISGIGGPHQGVYLCRSTDAGGSWSEPELVGDGIANFDWSDVHTYGKIRELSDGTLLMPVWGRLRGERVAASAQLRSVDGGRTWDEGVVLCRGVIAQNELIELPDGRLMAIVASDDSPAGHGMMPLYWTFSEDKGRTWSDLELTMYPIYGHSPTLFLTRKGTLLCSYRWVGDLDQGWCGVGFSDYSHEGDWNGTWRNSPTLVWSTRSVHEPVTVGRTIGGYSSIIPLNDNRFMIFYFMSWGGDQGSETRDIEGVVYAEA